MKNYYIEETRKYLIKEYGEPSVKFVDNRKHIVLNSYLQAFDYLIDVLNRSVELLNLQDVDKQFNLICEYAKIENPIKLQLIANKMQKFNKQIEKDCRITKISICKFFDELSLVADDKNFNPSLILNYFSYYLNITFSDNTISRKSHKRIIKLEESNIALEDNNL